MRRTFMCFWSVTSTLILLSLIALGSSAESNQVLSPLGGRVSTEEVVFEYDDEDDDDDDDEDLEDYPADSLRLTQEVSERMLHHKKKPVWDMEGPPIPIEPVAPMYQPPQPIIEERQRVATCQSGYSLAGNDCILHELTESSFGCPPGQELMDGSCVEFARARRECPEGYRMSGGKCTAFEVVPVAYSCPGGQLDESGTGCETVELLGLQCPNGYILDGDTCLQRFPAVFECPPMYKQGTKGCVRTHEVAGTPMCPAGSEPEPDDPKRCFIMKNGKTRCPKGYRMGTDNGKCVKKIKKGLAQCPQGFEESRHSKKLCERIIEVPPQLSCPIGGYLDSTGMCVNEMPSMLSCPEGFAESRSVQGMCERIIEEIGSCPEGTVTVGYGPSLRCQSSIDLGMKECCPPGYDQIFGRCERAEVFRSSPSCTSDCTSVMKYPPIVICPDGSTLRGAVCLSQSSEPCANTESFDYSKCPPDNIQPQNLVSLRVLNEYSNECFKPRPLCQREETVAPEMRCRAGSFFDGEVCIERKNEIPKLTCRLGVLDETTGMCRKVSTAPMTYECEGGSTRVGNRCVIYEEFPPLLSCPEESIVDRSTGSCVVRTPAARKAGNGIKSPAIALCPLGTMKNGVCLDVEVTTRQHICPRMGVPAEKQDKGDSKYCLLYADVLFPVQKKKHVKPLYFCPNGEMAKKRFCHSKETIQPTRVCPEATVNEGSNMCIRRVNAVESPPRIRAAVAIPTCPPGTVVQGTKCVAMIEMESRIVCYPPFQPSGINEEGKECAKTSPMVALCPAGTEQTMDGCIRVRMTPATISHVPLQSDCGVESC